MLIDDLKADLGITGDTQDDYLLAYCLVPAVNQATILSLNLKMTTVTLTAGTQTYDLTDSSITDPVVASVGVQELNYDQNYDWNYRYKKDFYIKADASGNNTVLYFVDSEIPGSGDFEFKYNEYFTHPTDSIDGNIPEVLKPSVKKWALAEYGLIQIDKGVGLNDGSSGVSSKSEEGMSISYGSLDSQQKKLSDSKRDAELQMIDLGANGKFNFFSIQVV